MSDLDEWRYAVRDMSERDRQHTAQELRAADGLSTADGPDGDER